MTVYATRLVNGTDSRERLRRADALSLFPSGAGMARAGFRNDGGGVVTVNAGTMTVDVSPFMAWVDGGVSDAQGGYTFVSDTTETLTVAAGDASLERTDVVIAEVRDTTHDGSGATDARLRILAGTPGAGVPALPTNALALRNITVPAGLSSGTGGLASGNLSTDRRTYTAALGGILSVASATERDALLQVEGTMVYRRDGGYHEALLPAGWERVQADDTGWVDLANTIATGAVKYRRKGNQVTVRLSGSGATTSGVTYTISSTALPVELRPSLDMKDSCTFDSLGGAMVVLSTGHVQIAQVTGATRNTFAGIITYPVE